MTTRKLAPVQSASGSTGDAELLVAYCARPKCRKKIERPAGPGRPRFYCSDECRTKARDEQRLLRSRLARYEDVVEQIRIDIAAFGHSSDEEAPEQFEVIERCASDALARARGLLVFAPEADALTGELRALVEACAPLVKTRISQAS